MTGRLRRVLEDRCSSNIQTHIVDDCHGHQKNSSWTTTGRRFRKASVSMAVVLEQDVVGTRHRFKNPAMNAPVRSTDSKLGNEFFTPDRKAIASTTQQAQWWSPSASGLMLPHSDFALLRQARDSGSFHNAPDAWFGEAFSLTHRIAMGLPVSHGVVEWFFCLRHLPKGPVACCKADLKNIEGTNLLCLEPRFGADALCLRAVFSVAPEDLKVVCYDWRSWFCQAKTLPIASRRSLRPAVRAVVDMHGVQSSQVAGARAAWWTLGRSVIADYARHFGIHLEAGSSLADVLWAMIKGALDTDDAATLALLRRRVARDASDNPHSEALMQVDEALEVIGHMDVRKVQGRRSMRPAPALPRRRASSPTSWRRRQLCEARRPSRRRGGQEAAPQLLGRRRRFWRCRRTTAHRRMRRRSSRLRRAFGGRWRAGSGAAIAPAAPGSQSPSVGTAAAARLCKHACGACGLSTWRRQRRLAPSALFGGFLRSPLVGGTTLDVVRGRQIERPSGEGHRRLGQGRSLEQNADLRMTSVHGERFSCSATGVLWPSCLRCTYMPAIVHGGVLCPVPSAPLLRLSCVPSCAGVLALERGAVAPSVELRSRSASWGRMHVFSPGARQLHSGLGI